MTDDVRGAALTVWTAVQRGLEDPGPDITLDAETAADPVAQAARLALLWMRKWHRLALAAGVTAETVQEIDGKAELVAVAEDSVRKYVAGQIAALHADHDDDAPAAAIDPGLADVTDLTRLDGLGRSAKFQAKAWDFISACEEGTAGPSEDDHYLAAWLAGMLRGLFVNYDMTAHGSSREQAQAAYTAMVAGQQAIYGSLASMEQEPADGAGHAGCSGRPE